jgi:hypothetical protein
MYNIKQFSKECLEVLNYKRAKFERRGAQARKIVVWVIVGMKIGPYTINQVTDVSQDLLPGTCQIVFQESETGALYSIIDNKSPVGLSFCTNLSTGKIEITPGELEKFSRNDWNVTFSEPSE